MKTAVVIGSTGLTGSILVKKLVQEGSFGQIIAICRVKKAANSTVFTSPKVRLVEFDFLNWIELEMQIGSFIGTSQASFFCCLGTTIRRAGTKEAFTKVDNDYVVNFARLAQACRAEQLIVVSALGADKNSNVFYNKTKGEMEERVQLAYSGKLHFLRPSLLLGDRKDFRFFERIAILAAPLYSSLLFGSWRKFRPIAAEKVAHTMLLLGEKKLSAGVIVDNSEIAQNN